MRDVCLHWTVDTSSNVNKNDDKYKSLEYDVFNYVNYNHENDPLAGLKLFITQNKTSLIFTYTGL